jgi:DNA-directed RNA polymerase specialized sigma24 family protein
MGEGGHFGAALSEMFGLSEAEGVTLARRLRGKAEGLVKRFGVDASEAEALLQEALRRALERDRGDTIENPYGWLTMVMRNELINQSQRGKKHRAWEEAQGGGGADGGLRAQVSAQEALRAEGSSLRAVLDQLSWEPERSNGVHYFAVLLLALRLNALARYDAALDEPTRRALEAVVRWHEAEERWRLTEELAPRLREYWGVVVRQARRSSLSLGEAVRLLEAELAPGLSVKWYKWKERATKQAQGRCSAASWSQLEEMLTLRGEAA